MRVICLTKVPSQCPKRRLFVRSRKVSKPRDCRIALKFDRHIGSTAAEVHVKFQSDQTILNTHLAASRLYEILRKDVFSDIETEPRWHAQLTCLPHVYASLNIDILRLLSYYFTLYAQLTCLPHAYASPNIDILRLLSYYFTLYAQLTCLPHAYASLNIDILRVLSYYFTLYAQLTCLPHAYASLNIDILRLLFYHFTLYERSYTIISCTGARSPVYVIDPLW